MSLWKPYNKRETAVGTAPTCLIYSGKRLQNDFPSQSCKKITTHTHQNDDWTTTHHFWDSSHRSWGLDKPCRVWLKSLLTLEQASRHQITFTTGFNARSTRNSSFVGHSSLSLQTSNILVLWTKSSAYPAQCLGEEWKMHFRGILTHRPQSMECWFKRLEFLNKLPSWPLSEASLCLLSL